jgi:hypothetical protein
MKEEGGIAVGGGGGRVYKVMAGSRARARHHINCLARGARAHHVNCASALTGPR